MPTHETVQIKRLREMAARRGWSWTPEPASGFCGRLKISGQVRYVIGADLGVNSSAAARVSRDKAFTQHFLAEAGLPVIPTRILHAPAEVVAVEQFPVVLKPNEGQGGAGVSVVSAPSKILHAYHFARKYSALVLSQPVIEQREFRIVVFNRRALLAYERRPLALVGDGRRCIRELLPKEFHDDERVINRLAEHQLQLHSILAPGQVYLPLAVANLKSGGTWRECLGELSPALLAGSISAAETLGLVMAGIDLFAASPSAGSYLINEVNASPGLEFIAGEDAILSPLFDEVERYLRAGPRATQ